MESRVNGTDHPDVLPIGKHDPILQELWATKAKLNAEAAYSVEKLAQAANEFDVRDAAKRLGVRWN